MADTTFDKVAEQLNKNKEELSKAQEALTKLKGISNPTDEQMKEMKQIKRIVTNLKSRVTYYERDRAVRLNKYATDATIRERYNKKAKKYVSDMKAELKALKEQVAQSSMVADN